MQKRYSSLSLHISLLCTWNPCCCTCAYDHYNQFSSLPVKVFVRLSFFSSIHQFCVKCVWIGVMACQPASLPATAPAPKPAGTFALWLQFPGMPNLRQLLRTCYLCQQCAGSAHHITCHSVSIWARDWICVRIVCQRITVPLTHHICICISSCVHECKAFFVCSMHCANVYKQRCC